MVSFPRARIVAVLVCLCCGSAGAVAIPGLYSTGVGDSGSLLGDGATDAHYSIVEVGNVGAVVIEQAIIPPLTHNAWLANGPDSRWIWQTAKGTPLGVIRTFRITFDLTGLDPSTAQITGQWATDNFGLDVLVNGISTGQEIESVANGGNEFWRWTPFSVSSSLLVQGLNTIDFKVEDVGSIAGFRAEFLTATADAMPVPTPDSGGSLWLLVFGTLFLVFQS